MRAVCGIAALCLLAAAGCRPQARFDGAVYRDHAVAFRVGALPPAWRTVRVEGGHLALHHEQGGTISADATCERIDDVPLDVLTNHLLFGVEERAERSRVRMTLDGRAALRTRIDGRLDGVPVALDLVVLKKDGCVIDLQLIAGPEALPARAPDFERFVAGFARLARLEDPAPARDEAPR